MTCLKITESQNCQIYPEDTFSHGAAHFYFVKSFYMEKMEKKFGWTGKSLENLLKMLKKFRVGGKKLDMVR